jgi:flagellar biosynthesis GTPase FlhF
MDFSMPSYEEGAKSSVTEAPSFGNPFADLKLPSLGGSDVSVDKTADKAAAKAAKEAEQKAKEDQKAVKEAEKEARRQEQLQKQKEAVARSAKVKEGEAANLVSTKQTTASGSFNISCELKLVIRHAWISLHQLL